MTGSLPLREAGLAAIAQRLTSTMPGVVVERARRAPVDVDTDTLPRLILRGEEWQADETEEPGLTHYRLAFSVTGFVSASTDLAAEQALCLLHAQLVQTLAGWTPSTPGLGDAPLAAAAMQCVPSLACPHSRVHGGTAPVVCC